MNIVAQVLSTSRTSNWNHKYEAKANQLYCHALGFDHLPGTMRSVQAKAQLQSVCVCVFVLINAIAISTATATAARMLPRTENTERRAANSF